MANDDSPFHLTDAHRPPRRSSNSRSRRHSHSTSSLEKPAYDVLLSCRTADPVSDAYSRDIKQLPSHWQPTFISNLTRAASQRLGALNPDHQQQQHQERRFSDTHKPSGSWKRRVFRPAQEQKHTDTLLPRLSFQNPWHSFRAPAILDLLNGGLKWGLPEGYQEGGSHPKVRANKPMAAKNIKRQEDAGIQHGLHQDWDQVNVRTPDWGWPARFSTRENHGAHQADRQTDDDKNGRNTKKASHDHQADAEANGHAQHANAHVAAADRDVDASAVFDDGDAVDTAPELKASGSTKPLPEWIDPKSGNVPAARVTWLGHATVLLQLPSLGNEDSLQVDELYDEPTEYKGETTSPAATNNGSSHEAAQAADKDVANTNASAQDNEGGAKRDADGSSADKAENLAGDRVTAVEGNGDGEAAYNKKENLHHHHQQQPRRPYTRERLGNRSVNILFDPVFSERCSPSQSAGPQRFTPTPCQVEDLPPIDIVCISHSHYDHLDYLTMKALRKQRGRKIHAFVGLGLKDKIVEFGWSAEQVSELDWWDSAVLQVHEPQVANVFSNPSSTHLATRGQGSAESKLVSKIRQDRAKLRIVCTPAQHGSGRVGDKDQTLWCSWVVEWMSPRHTANPSTEKRIPATFRAFFAGDTGLKYHRENVEKRAKYPACPAFEQIATRIGRPDLLMLPISVGSSLSYARSFDPIPRAFSPFPRISSSLTSSIHMDPYDAVETHEIMRTAGTSTSEKQSEEEEGRETGSKRLPISLAVHYGTFVRNNNQTEADVRQLRKACERSKLTFQRVHDSHVDYGAVKDADREKGVFLVSHQGETIWLPFVWDQRAGQK